MSVSADRQGRALMILAISGARSLSSEEIDKVSGFDDIRSVRQVELPS